ncbi:hypothetical protein CXG81DRAFT_24503 [Caulochytrium protostelioides]|uniref:Uncharacterized protein n=1 Tax=Caulochytrium protostelioides TaxID=1555241 RepID=A0A4P9XBU3_9FUNG|nr:hypothetical protein CXG81DRAFT_24503 [Caulochytrium protostelioides]|eukprot:RKP02904.1 hypothetical protein CXG81DRAFT_24503 [Caulochytrium protostelioides]
MPSPAPRVPFRPILAGLAGLAVLATFAGLSAIPVSTAMPSEPAARADGGDAPPPSSSSSAVAAVLRELYDGVPDLPAYYDACEDPAKTLEALDALKTWPALPETLTPAALSTALESFLAPIETAGLRESPLWAHWETWTASDAAMTVPWQHAVETTNRIAAEARRDAAPANSRLSGLLSPVSTYMFHAVPTALFPFSTDLGAWIGFAEFLGDLGDSRAAVIQNLAKIGAADSADVDSLERLCRVVAMRRIMLSQRALLVRLQVMTANLQTWVPALQKAIGALDAFQHGLAEVSDAPLTVEVAGVLQMIEWARQQFEAQAYRYLGPAAVFGPSDPVSIPVLLREAVIGVHPTVRAAEQAPDPPTVVQLRHPSVKQALHQFLPKLMDGMTQQLADVAATIAKLTHATQLMVDLYVVQVNQCAEWINAVQALAGERYPELETPRNPYYATAFWQRYGISSPPWARPSGLIGRVQRVSRWTDVYLQKFEREQQPRVEETFMGLVGLRNEAPRRR